jgi:hypothetical protein
MHWLASAGGEGPGTVRPSEMEIGAEDGGTDGETSFNVCLLGCSERRWLGTLGILPRAFTRHLMLRGAEAALTLPWSQGQTEGRSTGSSY